jgi:hypothetical protein
MITCLGVNLETLSFRGTLRAEESLGALCITRKTKTDPHSARNHLAYSLLNKLCYEVNLLES